MEPLPKAVRLNKLVELLRARKAGMSPHELARLTGVSVRSIQRDLLTIQLALSTPLTKHGDRYVVVDERLPALDLELQEARAMLIATRLFLRYSDEADAHADERPPQAGAHHAAASPRAGAAPPPSHCRVRPFDAEFSRNLVTVTEAWARRRVLRLSYRSAGRQRPKEIVVEPYFLEPSAAGFATYLIGYSRTHNQMRTFKVERIVSAEMLPRAVRRCPTTSTSTRCSRRRGASSGAKARRCALRFAPDVAWRVKESRWHPTQSLEDLADGGVHPDSQRRERRWRSAAGCGAGATRSRSSSRRRSAKSCASEAVRLARTYSAARNQRSAPASAWRLSDRPRATNAGAARVRSASITSARRTLCASAAVLESGGI